MRLWIDLSEQEKEDTENWKGKLFNFLDIYVKSSIEKPRAKKKKEYWRLYVYEIIFSSIRKIIFLKARMC